MSEAILSRYYDAIERRDAMRTHLTEQLSAAARDGEGQRQLTPKEESTFAELRAIEDELESLTHDVERLGLDKISDLSARTRGNQRNAHMNSHLVYRPNDNRASFFRDLVKTHLREDPGGECRSRLERHSEQVATDPIFDRPEYRADSTAQGAGGWFVPPAWLMDQYVRFARPGRVTADLLGKYALPPGTNSINVPKILTGTATGIQYPENTQVVEQDITDTFINAQVRTIAGQQSVSQQLFDQSPIAMDQLILEDLSKAHAVNLNQQVLYGTGTNGQLEGISIWPNINTIAVSDPTSIQSIYNALANGIQTIWTNRFDAPTAIIVHPRRWASWLAMLDDNHRPLFLPQSNNPMNAAGLQEGVPAQGRVGEVMTIPVYQDAVLSTTLGGGSTAGTEDSVFILRASDIALYESGVFARVLPEPLAQTLTVLIQLWSYCAMAVRYPSSIVEITGFTAPTFG